MSGKGVPACEIHFCTPEVRSSDKFILRRSRHIEEGVLHKEMMKAEDFSAGFVLRKEGVFHLN